MIDLNFTKVLGRPNEGITLNVNAEIDSGSFVTIYGPSGAGKTSTLRIMAGLMAPDSGKIIVGESTWYHKDDKIDLPAPKKKGGLCFSGLRPFSAYEYQAEFTICSKFRI